MSINKKWLYLFCLLVANAIVVYYFLTVENIENSITETVTIKDIVCKKHNPITLTSTEGQEFYLLTGLKECSKEKYIGSVAEISSSDNVIISLKINNSMLFNKQNHIESRMLVIGFIALFVNALFIRLILHQEKQPNK